MENDVLKLLDSLNIKYTKFNHPPLFTCEDNNKYDINFDALICKNLFIKNSNKSQYYVIVLPLEKRLNLKSLQSILKETRLSFGNEKELEEILGTQPGSVSIFNIINKKNNDIIFVLDTCIMKYKKLGFHPNINTSTVTFNSKEITKIFKYYNIKYKFFEL